MIKIRISSEDPQELVGVVRLLRGLPGLAIRSCRCPPNGAERYKKAYIVADLPERAIKGDNERSQRFQNKRITPGKADFLG